VVVNARHQILRLIRWLLTPRGKTVRQGGLFHELNQRQLPTELAEEVGGKLKKKFGAKSYRDE
jgi:cobalamin biosynthesis Mg chelatase CobN